MNKVKILAIVGSFRKDSFNMQLAMAAKRITGDRADFEILEYQDVPLFNQDIEYPAPETVRRVRNAVKSADGIWFFTPGVQSLFPWCIKDLIDWLSRSASDSEPQVLDGKPATISGISPGMSGTGIAQDHLVTLISFLNMDVMNTPRAAVPYAMQHLDSNSRLDLKEESYRPSLGRKWEQVFTCWQENAMGSKIFLRSILISWKSTKRFIPG